MAGSKTQFQTLLAYHWDTKRRLLEGIARLDAGSYQEDPGEGRRSMHQLLLHQLNTESAWRQGLETGKQPEPIRPEDYPDLAALQAAFKDEQQAWQQILDRLSNEEIEGDAHMTTRRGDSIPIPRWRVLQHVILHGMQHHAEIAQLLTAKGQSPGDIDFIFFRG